MNIDIESNEELKELNCPKCKKNMEYITYSQKYNLKFHMFAENKEGYWYCKKCDIKCYISFNPIYKNILSKNSN